MMMKGVLCVLLATSIGCGLAFQNPCIRSRVPVHPSVSPRCCARRSTIRCVLRSPMDSVFISYMWRIDLLAKQVPFQPMDRMHMVAIPPCLSFMIRGMES